MNLQYNFDAEIWVYSGEGAWNFITVPKAYAAEIKEVSGTARRVGFGSVKVLATINDLSWETSIFPDKKSGSYILPIKKAVRAKLGVASEDTVAITLQLLL